MSYSNKFYEIMKLLGCGNSVATVCNKAGISFEELCEEAEKYNELKIELERWYPRFDFTVKPKEKKEETVKQTQSDSVKEEKDDVSGGKQSKQGQAKGKSK